MNWQLQEAKNKLSEVVQKAQTSGPQVITVRGKEAAVVISAQDYHKFTTKKESFLSFMQHSPWSDVDLDIQRMKDTGREISL